MPAMSAVAQEMLEVADEFAGEAKAHRAMGDLEEARKCELAVIALRESALSRNAVVGERMI